MVRENSFVEAFNYIKKMDSIRENKIQQQLNESIQKHKEEIDRIQNIRESRELKIRNHSKLLEDCKNDALATVLKAIYIEALVPSSLTDNGIILAESLVDSWIKQKGGASRIIVENRNKTYLLNRLCNIAEKAALLEAEEVENIEKEDEGEANSDSKGSSEEDKKAKVSELMAQAQELIAKAEAIQNGEDVDTDTSAEDGESSEEVSADDLSSDESESEPEETSDDSEAEDSGEESKEEEIEDDEEEVEEDEDDLEEDEDELEEDEDDLEEDEEEEAEEENEETSEDDSEESEDDFEDDEDLPEDEDDGLDDGEESDVEDDGNVDGSDITGEDMDDSEPVSVNDTDDTDEEGEKDTSPKGQIFDELEDEEDVKKAVQIINQRVSDAEEDFIKRNAEDKKKIDDLIGKISDNIKTVEDISNNDDPKSKVAEESVRMYNRQIKNITENRVQKVFEKMVRKLSESAVKDPVLKESYTLESGKLDIGGIIESAKVMYGFLETLNTLQLERIDKNYIMDMIKEL